MLGCGCDRLVESDLLAHESSHVLISGPADTGIISLIFVQSSLVCFQDSCTVCDSIYRQQQSFRDLPDLLRNIAESVGVDCGKKTSKEVHLKMPTFNIVVFAGDYAGPEVRPPMFT